MALIERSAFTTLVSFRDILESKGELDLVSRTRKRRISLDYDYKQKLVRNADGTISPHTVPHRDVAEMHRYRSAMEAVRKSGVEALPDLVLRRVAVKEARMRLRGGDSVSVTRQFLRGMLQKRFQATYAEFNNIADQVNAVWAKLGLASDLSKKIWKKADMQNASTRGLWTPGCIMPNQKLRGLVEHLCTVFQADLEHVNDLIFNVDTHFDYTDALVEQVAMAVLFAAGHGVTIFEHLREMGYLPSLQGLQEIFPTITSQMIKRFTNDPFSPGLLPSRDFERLMYMFHQLSIPWRFCEECARVIAPTATRSSHIKRHNPSKTVCLERLVQALFQRNISARHLTVSTIIERLHEFDITRSRIYVLRKTKFVPNSVPDTRENRFLIKRVTKRLRRPSEPYILAILAPVRVSI